MKNEGGEKKVDAGKKDDGGAAPAVYKFDMHCEGCAKKIKRFVRHMDGVENVKADTSANKLTVEGKIDPSKLRERLAERTGKKVDLISPLPKKADAKDGGGGGGEKKADGKDGGGGGEKKSDEKSEKKADDKKADDKKPKEVPVSTVALKTRLHCDGCIQKIKRVIGKYKGVEKVDVDGAKDLITVKGKMDVKSLVPYLKEKLKRPIDMVVPAKKDDGGDKKEKGGDGGGEKKDKEAAGGGGGDKKDKAVAAAGGGGGGGDGGVKVEANKMEHYGTYGYHQPAPSFWYGGPEHVYGQAYMMEAGPSNSNQVPHPHHNYAVDHYSEPPMAYAYHPHHDAPQMFSDENPNACSVM